MCAPSAVYARSSVDQNVLYGIQYVIQVVYIKMLYIKVVYTKMSSWIVEKFNPMSSEAFYNLI